MDISLNNRENNKKYVNIDITDFDIKNLKIDKDKHNRYITTYSANYSGCNFDIIPNTCFNSYGIQINNENNSIYSNDNISESSEFTDNNKFNNLKKVSIIFNDNDVDHIKYKVVIIDIYSKLKEFFKNSKIVDTVRNPINDYNAMNIEITDKTLLYKYTDNNKKVKMLSFKKFIEYRNFSFKISPVIYFKKFNIKNGIMYFNFGIKSAIIEYTDFIPMNIDKIINIFNKNSIKTNIISGIINKNNLDNIDENNENLSIKFS
jgi:hypothetical protein